MENTPKPNNESANFVVNPSEAQAMAEVGDFYRTEAKYYQEDANSIRDDAFDVKRDGNEAEYQRLDKEADWYDQNTSKALEGAEKAEQKAAEEYEANGNR